MTTALLHLRALQCGLSLYDMKLITVGMVYDMFIESGNDSHEYDYIATQEDIDNL